MKAGHTVVVVAVVALLLLAEVRGQQCQSLFQTGLLECTSSSNVTASSFLWVATNRSMGQTPSNLPAFQASLCGAAPALLQCGESFIEQLLASPACEPVPGTQDLRPVVEAEFGLAAFNVRQFCGLPEPVPPCQQSFEDSLASCGANSSLSPQNFLWAASNQSRGQAPPNPAAFRAQACGSLAPVLQCLRAARPRLFASPACLPRPGAQDFRRVLATEFNFVNVALQEFCGLQPNVTQQPPEVPPCQQSFEAGLASCAANSSLSPQNFLWAASRQNRGQAPANPVAFRASLCSAAAQLMTCGQGLIRQLAQAPQCQPGQDATDFRPVIQSEYQFVLEALQQYCASAPGQRRGNINV